MKRFFTSIKAEIRPKRLDETADFRDHLHHPFRFVQCLLVISCIHDVHEVKKIFAFECLHGTGHLFFVWHREREVVDRLPLSGIVVGLEMLLENALRPELGGAFANIEKPLVNVLAGIYDFHVIRETYCHKSSCVIISQFVSHWLTNYNFIRLKMLFLFFWHRESQFASQWLTNLLWRPGLVENAHILHIFRRAPPRSPGSSF